MKALRLLYPCLMAGIFFSAVHAEPFRAHLGLQLYSLRDQFKEDVVGALDRTKAWGFVEVETAGTGGLPVGQFREMLRTRGLLPVSAHFGFDRLDKDLAGAVSEAKALGVEYAICPSIPHQGDMFDDAAARQAAAKFNQWGAAFKAAGIQFGYHTHGFEFHPSASGGNDRVFDVLVAPRIPDWSASRWTFCGSITPVWLRSRCCKNIPTAGSCCI